MGKIQCTSSKTKTSCTNDPIIIFNNKPQNWYEKKLKDEYLRLKDLTEGKRRTPAIDFAFGLNDYKKQLSRFIKWSRIAYEKVPSNYQELKERRNSKCVKGKSANVSFL